VLCLVLPRLDYCNAVLAGIPLHLCTALAIGDERGRTARLRVIKVRPHHAAPTPITLTESSMADRLQAGRSGLQTSSWPGTVIPR